MPSYGVRFDTPFYTGRPVSDLVPSLYDVALNGRPYLLNLEHQAVEAWGTYYKRESQPLIRDQADQSDVPGEHSISPNQFWRRSTESWHLGAGQNYLDRKTSSPYRFRSSKGVNPWQQWQLSLLNDTASSRTSTNTGLLLAVAGSNVYLADGNALVGSANGTSWTAVTGTPASACASVCSDGYNVYAAYGANGIYSLTSGAAAAASFATGTVNLVGYAKGRLMAAAGAALYNITAGGALPTALMTHRATAWTWVGFADGPSAIYAAGYVGGHSEIYSITIVDTGTNLGAPTIAGVLPEGEIVRSIYSYEGQVIIGSDKGVRFAAVNSNNSLNIGPLIPISSPVYCMDGSDRFVWFGWSNYDATSTGLGRLDLSVSTQPLTPAYASDLMATAQGVVRSTVNFAGARLFAVDGVGVFREQVGTPVASGTVSTGFIAFDLADPKIAAFVALRHEPLPSGASVGVAIAVDNGGFVSVGTSSVATSTQTPDPISTNLVRGERFELQATLTKGTSTSGPTLLRYTLLAYPAPTRTSAWNVPLLLFDQVNPVGGGDRSQDVGIEYDALVSLHSTQNEFTYQEGSQSYSVVMDDFVWLGYKRSATNPGRFQGTFVCKLREITG